MSGENTPQAAVSPAPKPKRTYDRHHRRDRYAIASRWAAVSTRSREGKFIQEVRADLIRHVGGKPSATQRIMIERAAMLALQIARMDAKALEGGEISDVGSRRYLAWSNSLVRTCAALGATPRKDTKPPSIADYIASRP